MISAGNEFDDQSAALAIKDDDVCLDDFAVHASPPFVEEVLEQQRELRSSNSLKKGILVQVLRRRWVQRPFPDSPGAFVFA